MRASSDALLGGGRPRRFRHLPDELRQASALEGATMMRPGRLASLSRLEPMGAHGLTRQHCAIDGAGAVFGPKQDGEKGRQSANGCIPFSSGPFFLPSVGARRVRRVSAHQARAPRATKGPPTRPRPEARAHRRGPSPRAARARRGSCRKGAELDLSRQSLGASLVPLIPAVPAWGGPPSARAWPRAALPAAVALATCRGSPW